MRTCDVSTCARRAPSFALRDGGSGPPLLLLHGNPNNHVIWCAFAARLAERMVVSSVAAV
jgi:pimeloyl-ACP methyl ester carboxylesterase